MWLLKGYDCVLCAQVIGITYTQQLLTSCETIRFQGRNSTNLLASLEVFYGLHSTTNFSSLSQISKNHHPLSPRSVKLILCVIISLKTLLGVFVSVSIYISISRVRTLWTERSRVRIVAVCSTSLVPFVCPRPADTVSSTCQSENHQFR